MAFKPLQIPQEEEQSPLEWRPPNLAGGLCLEDLEMKLFDNQASTMLNMWYRERVLSKRYGQEYINETPASSSPVYQAYKGKYKGYKIYHSGTKLYKMADDGTETEIFSGVGTSKGTFFVFNDILYYKNEGYYTQWNNTTATSVVGFIPVVVINRTPTGGGDTFQNYNRISAGFTTWFNGNNVAVSYQLPQSTLDATTVTLTVGGVVLVEGVGFTVNRTTGIVTFSVAPATGTNNVKITAYKTDTTLRDEILNCKYAESFGGDNETRMFLAGNGTSEFYFSGLQDPTYFPDSNNNLVGSNDEDITGFGEQYNVLCIFKSNSIYGTTYSFDGTTARFSTKPINSNIGCDMPWTIQLIDNKLTWCNTYAGVHILLSTDIQDERNIKPISRNINGTVLRAGLLAESNLTNASSIDAYGKYWVCVNDKVYVWDYSISPYVNTGNTDQDSRNLSWFYFDNINANTWIIDNSDLYYGDRTTGYIVHFVNNFRDFEAAINAKYRMALRDFGYPDWLKTVTELWITSRTDTYSQIELKYITENNPDGRIDSQPIITGSFTWGNFAWNTFTWLVLNFAKTYRRRPRSKNVTYWALEVENNQANRDLSIIDIVLWYTLDKKVK